MAFPYVIPDDLDCDKYEIYSLLNDAVEEIASRAGKLSDMKMDDLRMIVGQDDSANARREELRGCSKGDLVAGIIETEFLDPQ